MTAQRQFDVVAPDAQEAISAAKEQAVREGLRVVTVASCRKAADGLSWAVVLAVRL